MFFRYGAADTPEKYILSFYYYLSSKLQTEVVTGDIPKASLYKYLVTKTTLFPCPLVCIHRASISGRQNTISMNIFCLCLSLPLVIAMMKRKSKKEKTVKEHNLSGPVKLLCSIVPCLNFTQQQPYQE